MGQPAAKQGDQIIATDTHIVMVPAGPSPVPTPLPHPFTGIINGGLSSDVNIMGLPAATVDSTADNTPPHIPMPPGTTFQKPPSNKATIKVALATPLYIAVGWRINDDMLKRTGTVGFDNICLTVAPTP